MRRRKVKKFKVMDLLKLDGVTLSVSPSKTKNWVNVRIIKKRAKKGGK